VTNSALIAGAVCTGGFQEQASARRRRRPYCHRIQAACALAYEPLSLAGTETDLTDCVGYQELANC
jgi:hypothetical protein